MPALKKPVYDAIKKLLESDQSSLRAKIRRRTFEMKKLAHEQALDKRQLAALSELIRSMEPIP